jgi:hydrogenase maturation protease
MRTRVIGVGNAYRSDDGAGIQAARRLRERCDDELDVVEASGEGTSLMEAWEGFVRVIVVDAVRAGRAPGTVYRFDAAAETVPSDFLRYSTHAFGVAEAIELARVLGTLPRGLILYGIEGASFGSGEDLSAEVAEAIEWVVADIGAFVGARELST